MHVGKIFKKKTKKQKNRNRLTDRKQTYGYQRGKVGVGINYEFGTERYTQIYINKTARTYYIQHRELYSISYNNL